MDYQHRKFLMLEAHFCFVIYMYIYTFMYVYVYTRTCVYVNAYTYTPIYTQTHTYENYRIVCQYRIFLALVTNFHYLQYVFSIYEL